MIILFDDIVRRSTLTSLNASNNYPVDNLKDTSLTKRLQSSIDNDTVTITPEDGLEFSVRDVWYAYTNATLIRFDFYDVYGGLITSVTITPPEPDIDHVSSPVLIEDVSYVEMYFEGPADVYIGSCGIGVAYVLPDPLATWTENDIDNSTVSESPFGQTGQDKILALREYPFKVTNVSRATTNIIQGLIRGVGKGCPLWTDPIENNHTFMKPLYGKLTTGSQVNKDGWKYTLTITIREAR